MPPQDLRRKELMEKLRELGVNLDMEMGMDTEMAGLESRTGVIAETGGGDSDVDELVNGVSFMDVDD